TRRIFVLSLLSFALVCGCGRPERTAETGGADAGQPAQGDWVILRYESEPDSLNPLLSRGAYSDYAMIGINNSQIYELLMRYNTKDFSFSDPVLAEAPPQISPDHLTYSFKIRDGVKWHDGKPFTAEDVLFTFKAGMCPLVDSANRRSYFTDLKDVRLEDRTIRFVVGKPNAFNAVFLANTFGIIPKHIFDPDGLLDGFSYADIIGPKGKSDPKIMKFADDFNKHPNNRSPIGTGPYKFEKWDGGHELSLIRNDDYWGKKAYLDKIVIRIIPDFPAALTALKAGDVDFIPRLLPIQYAQQTSGAAFDQQFAKAKYSIPTYSFIMWNEERPFFKDKRVRQALTMLINRQQFIDTVLFGLGRIGVSHFNPSAKDFDPHLKPWPYDPKRAAELLDEAGWIDHDGDGIRDKDGVKFKFEFLASSSNAYLPQLLPVLKEEFRKAGIEMTERTVEFNVMTGAVQEHRFDASALSWSADLIADPYQVFHSSAALNKGSNFISFKNAESDRLIEKARLEFDDEKRKQIYWQWQELIHEEQPYTFLFYREEPAAYSKRFRNVQWLPLRPGYDLNSWFVPSSEQKYKKDLRAVVE
ncbi:MAG TPA: peptide-binding protein, partial [Terriglobia bacterium]|nr:peptide-binding protein [Terriglobia bacterium]